MTDTKTAECEFPKIPGFLEACASRSRIAAIWTSVYLVINYILVTSENPAFFAGASIDVVVKYHSPFGVMFLAFLAAFAVIDAAGARTYLLLKQLVMTFIFNAVAQVLVFGV